MGHQKMSETTKRKTIRRIILIVLAAVLVLSAVIIGMCLFNERPAVQTVATYQSTYCDTVISVAEDSGVEILPRNTDADIGIVFYVGAQITPASTSRTGKSLNVT